VQCQHGRCAACPEGPATRADGLPTGPGVACGGTRSRWGLPHRVVPPFSGRAAVLAGPVPRVAPAPRSAAVGV